MGTPNVDRPLRVIQWTTGNIGRRSLHAIISRPDMELVGVYAHGADKVGVDAAELAGWPEPTGVTATDDIDVLIALQPDACCYNPLWPNIDELSRLLEAGINVCSSAAWITGGKQTPEDLDRIRKACEKGDSTIFGSGAHPGMTNMVGMVLSGSCERVDEIRITESVDCSTYHKIPFDDIKQVVTAMGDRRLEIEFSRYHVPYFLVHREGEWERILGRVRAALLREQKMPTPPPRRSRFDDDDDYLPRRQQLLAGAGPANTKSRSSDMSDMSNIEERERRYLARAARWSTESVSL